MIGQEGVMLTFQQIYKYVQWNYQNAHNKFSWKKVLTLFQYAQNTRVGTDLFAI